MSAATLEAKSTTVSVQTNLRCQSCLSKVREGLDNADDVLEWSADLSDPRKIVTAEIASERPYEVLVRIIGEAGYVAEPIDVPASTKEEPQETTQSTKEQPFSLTTYKPLVLVVGYVIGFTLAMCWASGIWTPGAMMRYFMGGFFLGFAFFKLLGIQAFADAFSTYDILAKRSRTYALAYPFLEFGLGAAYVLGLQPQIINSVTALVMAVGLVGVIAAVRRKRAIQCACLGTVFNLPMSAVTIVENSVMIAMAVAALIMGS